MHWTHPHTLSTPVCFEPTLNSKHRRRMTCDFWNNSIDRVLWGQLRQIQISIKEDGCWSFFQICAEEKDRSWEHLTSDEREATQRLQINSILLHLSSSHFSVIFWHFCNFKNYRQVVGQGLFFSYWYCYSDVVWRSIVILLLCFSFFAVSLSAHFYVSALSACSVSCWNACCCVCSWVGWCVPVHWRTTPCGLRGTTARSVLLSTLPSAVDIVTHRWQPSHRHTRILKSTCGTWKLDICSAK